MKLDANGFKLLERKRRFKPQTLEIARRRLLNQEPAKDLAATYNVNLQRIYTIEQQITEAWRGLHLPPGWAEITLVAPKPLIQEFQRRIREARTALLRATERRLNSSQPAKSQIKPKRKKNV